MNQFWKKAAIAFMCGILVVSTVACGTAKEEQSQEKEIQDVSVSEIEEAVAEAYGEDYLAKMEYAPEEIKNVFGIDPELYEECLAKGPMITVHVDTFVAIKAKSGKTEEVETALKDYQEKLKADTLQYPMNIPKIQASEVKVYGDYVFFIMLGYADAEEGQSEEEMLKEFQKQNEKAVTAIEGVLYGI